MPTVLTINGGSSSIRFAFFEWPGDADGLPHNTFAGKLERIGQDDARLTFGAGSMAGSVALDSTAREKPVEFLIAWLEARPEFAGVAAVGHRVVHGMQHSKPELLSAALVTELQQMLPYDPEHLPRELELILALQRHSKIPQVVCFDTAFHRTMPRVATRLPLPRRFDAQGLQRYGFHGLSYTFLLAELRRRGDVAASRGRVVLAHLGSGASLAAVLDGRSVDTSMGFTPTAGLVMGTRTGDLDPGLMTYLAKTAGMSADRWQTLVNHESGLLGISEISSDIRDLLDREATDERAAEAVAVFCYQARKWIGAYAAVLGGLDTLVFAGGIGENSPVVRSRICGGLKFLGIELDHARNGCNAPLISADAATVAVRVIPTDEESVIATSTIDLIGLNAG